MNKQHFLAAAAIITLMSATPALAASSGAIGVNTGVATQAGLAASSGSGSLAAGLGVGVDAGVNAAYENEDADNGGLLGLGLFR
jgi:hypothetical protein